MSHYRFTAFDASGKEHEGTVEAANAQDAAKLLSGQGLRVRMVQEAKHAPQPGPSTQVPAPRPIQPAAPRPVQPQVPTVQRPAASQQRPTASRPAPRPASPPQAPQVVNMPTASQPTVHRTAAGTDKDIYFLFSQISAGLRAGLNVAEFFSTIGPRTSGIYRDSLQKLSSGAMEGIPMSAVMAQYPDLYPAGAVGGVRAGEKGGFLPDACDMIAQQAEAAHRFKRFFWFVWIILFNAVISIPGILLFRQALLASTRSTFAGGGNSSFNQVLNDMLAAAWHSLLYSVGPITLVCFILLYVFWKYMGASASKPFRHALGLKWPVFGSRAKHENLTIFSWTLSRLSAAGIPLQSAWEMSAAAVPNMAMSKRLGEVGQRVTGSEKISDAVYSSNLFPREYAPMIATGEYTGSLPGTMEQLSNASRAEFDAQQNYAKLRGGCWGVLLLAVTSGFVLGVVLYAWYVEVFKIVLKEPDTP